MKGPPVFLLAIDGIGDRALAELGGRTPLAAARTPAMDYLAANGQSGLADPVLPGIVPSTIQGTMAILGYDPLRYPIGRGVVEAIGCGLEPAPGDLALRGNWATIGDDHRIQDRRAGRIRDGALELAESLKDLPIAPPYTFQIGCGSEHRLAIVISGPDLSAKIKGSDPGDQNPNGIRITPQALDPADGAAVRSARLLDRLETEARERLVRNPLNLERVANALPAANGILTRGPGLMTTLPPPNWRGRGLCIAGDKTILGLGRMIGLDLLTSERMTANLDTDLAEKFQLARENLGRYDLVLLHVKACDIAAHNKDGPKKQKALEEIDIQLADLLSAWKSEIRIGITGDHTTWSGGGYHTDDPVPALIYGMDISADGISQFAENVAGKGRLGRFPMHRFLDWLLPPSVKRA